MTDRTSLLWLLIIAVSVDHVWHPFIFERELGRGLMVAGTLSLIFERFPVEEHLIWEVSLKLLIIHLYEYVVVPSLRLQSEWLMLSHFIPTSIKLSRINLHLLSLATRATLSLWVRSGYSDHLILVSYKCHLFKECFLLKMHLFPTDSQSHDPVLLLNRILRRLFYVWLLQLLIIWWRIERWGAGRRYHWV